MSELHVLPIESLGHNFIEGPYIPEGRDEYYLRNEQSPLPADGYRGLRADEIETLVKNGNTADNWDNILVTDHFLPHQIKNSEFYGLVRIGRLDQVMLEYHDLTVPVGITNSLIISCDIGDDAAIHDVRYLAHYIIGENTILMNLDEMHTSNHAKFGNGIVKQGEDEEVRIWLELINEAGGREVMPFDGMIAADAYLWAKYPNDKKLKSRLGEITQRMFDSRRGFYGTIGKRCFIKNSRIIKDVKIGDCCYIKGANKLKNLTINSTEEEPSQIGEGVELVNGIIGPGCHIFYGCKAVRFVMGQNSNLKYGARLINSYLGDNSTVSCCEILNNLIFPAHEQHHNNSFLIAALVMGQSNIAACATIGSNHNSRAPDGEIHAGRGFWPGLCVSVKHNCRFASFTLLAKGDFPAEMDIRLPFSLVNNDVSKDQLQIMPAYWWNYNMYALARNTWKFNTRDKRIVKVQNIEFDSLAPDTAEELFEGMALLEEWTAKAYLRKQGESAENKSADELAKLGRELLNGPSNKVDDLEILGEGAEKSHRKTVILKAQQGYQAYRAMLHHYAVNNLINYMKANPEAKLASMSKALAGERCRRWINLGGQLVGDKDLEALKADIGSGKLDTWHAIHEAYDRLWEKYPLDKQRHAFATLLDLLEIKELTPERWLQSLDGAVEIQRFIAEETYQSRKKDFDSPFRQMCYESTAEMEAVLGTAEGVSFVKQIRKETEEFTELVENLKQRG
ncbi:MAG: DUF4954 family protein [Planctomycetota bacterium]|nr:MAG: DUF4954 family protein [Planctomycetota bacterium]